MPDYAALAAQFGGAPAAPSARRQGPTVDYNALARQMGGTPVAAAPAAAPAQDAGLAKLLSQQQAMDDLSAGMRASAARTIYGGGDIIRGVVGADRIIDKPDVQAAMTPPDSRAGTLGYYGDQGAQFAIPLTKLSKATAGLSLGKRLLVDAGSSAAVAGVQSGGDTGTMEAAGVLGALVPPAVRGLGRAGAAAAGAANRAAAGAKDGGLGGAVAAALRTASPSEPHTMLLQALKPRSANVKFAGSLHRAMPEIKVTEAELGRPVANLQDLFDATTAAKKRVRAQFDQMAGPQRAAGFTVDLSPVGKAMAKSVPSKVRLEDPATAAAIYQKAGQYGRRFSLEEAEQLLKETNAELDAYYAKYPASQRASRTANPEIAHTVAQADALRTAIYHRLDEGTGAARELQRRYGSLMDVEQEAYRRLNVAARQQPESLAEQIAGAGAMGDLAEGAWKVAHGNIFGLAKIASARAQRAGAKFLKDQQTTDALIRRAFAGFKGSPSAVPIPPSTQVRGLLNRGPLVTPPPPDQSGGGTVRAAVMDTDTAGGPVYSSDPNHFSTPRVVNGEVVEDAPQTAANGSRPPQQLTAAPTRGALPPGPAQRALPPAPEPPPAPAAPEPPAVDGPKPAWLVREEQIEEAVKASKAGGAKHLDTMPLGVEALRGRRFKSLRDGKEWIARTVDNRGTVYFVSPDGQLSEQIGGDELAEFVLSEKSAAVRNFQKYDHDDRANLQASRRVGRRQRQAVGEHFYTHPDAPGRAFHTRKAADEAAARAQSAPEPPLKAPEAAKPSGRYSIRPGKYRDKQGFHISGPRTRIFTETRESADAIKAKLLRGEEPTLEDYSIGKPPAAVTPAKTTVTPAAEAKPQTPAAAAAEVTNELRRVVQTDGARDSAEVHRRIVNALEMELHTWKKEVDAAVSGGNELAAGQLLEVEIPGDGTFKIERNEQAIRGVIARIVKAGPKPWQGLVDRVKHPARPKPRPTW